MRAFDVWRGFQSLFTEGTDSPLAIARKYWRDPRDFTREFVNKYVPPVLKEAGDTAEFEYFRIDIITYVSRKDEAKAYGYSGSLKPQLWDLKVAFEHENASSDWLDEVIKLAHIRCPLRVVVGYFTTDAKKRDAALDFAAAMLAKKVGVTLAEEEEFLLILGDARVAPTKVSAATYTPYLYQNGVFQKQEW